MKLGDKIRHIRQIQNISQENVALELGISQKSYSEIENNKTNVSMEKLDKIANALKVSTEDIINYNANNVFYYNDNKIENAYVEKIDNLNKELIKELTKQHENHVNDLKEQINYLKEILKKDK